jgi:hypothetical protein
MCDCISKINEYLKSSNTQVIQTIAIKNNKLDVIGVRVLTDKIDSSRRGKAVSVTAAYCPFCGEKYDKS